MEATNNMKLVPVDGVPVEAGLIIAGLQVLAEAALFKFQTKAAACSDIKNNKHIQTIEAREDEKVAAIEAAAEAKRDAIIESAVGASPDEEFAIVKAAVDEWKATVIAAVDEKTDILLTELSKTVEQGRQEEAEYHAVYLREVIPILNASSNVRDVFGIKQKTLSLEEAQDRQRVARQINQTLAAHPLKMQAVEGENKTEEVLETIDELPNNPETPRRLPVAGPKTPGSVLRRLGNKLTGGLFKKKTKKSSMFTRRSKRRNPNLEDDNDRLA